MPTCVRCSKDVGLIGSVGFNKQSSRCGKCEGEIKQALPRFRNAFLQYTQDGIISSDEWSSLLSGSSGDRLDMNEALAYVRGDAIQLLDRTLTFAAADGMLTDEEEQYVLLLKNSLGVPDNVVAPLMQRMSYLKHLTSIRRGNLPTIPPSVRLESDEICHLEIPATFHKVNAKSVTAVPGRLLATNKKLRFLSQTGGAEIAWNTVMRVDMQNGGVYIELAKKTGNGFYAVQDPSRVQAILDTIARISKREVLSPGSSSTDSRHIPQDIKIAVWQRDQGKCVQCGANDYLEFDHIIPFSLGGASTVGNVQLLCRRCNLAKSDRI